MQEKTINRILYVLRFSGLALILAASKFKHRPAGYWMASVGCLLVGISTAIVLLSRWRLPYATTGQRIRGVAYYAIITLLWAVGTVWMGVLACTR